MHFANRVLRNVIMIANKNIANINILIFVFFFVLNNNMYNIIFDTIDYAVTQELCDYICEIYFVNCNICVFYIYVVYYVNANLIK